MTSSPQDKLKAGDEVRMFALFAISNDEPPAGWVAHIVAADESEYTARPDAWLSGNTITFARDDNRSTENGGQWSALLPEAAERRARYDAAMSTLAVNYVSLHPDNSLTLEQIEAIAAILRPAPEEG